MTFDQARFTWRYLSGGGVKHAFYAPPGPSSSARCGNGPQWFDPRGWLGTADADQRARLAELRPCLRCIDNLKRDRNPT